MPGLPINRPQDTQSGSLPNREAALHAELEQLRKTQIAIETEQKLAEELRIKQSTPPDEFVVLARGCVYIGVAQFNTPVQIRKGLRPQAKFYIVDEGTGQPLNNPVSQWFHCIAYLDASGWLKIWHQRTGEVLEVPGTNIAAVKRLDPKHIPQLSAAHKARSEAK